MGIDNKNKRWVLIIRTKSTSTVKKFYFYCTSSGYINGLAFAIVQLLNNFLQVQRRWPKAVSRVQVKAECSGKEKSSPHWLTYDENNCWLLLSLTGDRVIVIVIDYS